MSLSEPLLILEHILTLKSDPKDKKTKLQKDKNTFEALITILTIENREFMTIFVIRQLRVTLDSIRNSCDV